MLFPIAKNWGTFLDECTINRSVAEQYGPEKKMEKPVAAEGNDGKDGKHQVDPWDAWIA